MARKVGLSIMYGRTSSFKDLIQAYSSDIKNIMPKIQSDLNDRSIKYQKNSKSTELVVSSDDINEDEIDTMIHNTNLPNQVLKTFVKVKKSNTRIYIRQRLI